MEAARAASSFQITDDQDVSVEAQIRWISNKLASVPVNSAVLTGDWFEAQPTARAHAALLMALLELAHKGLVLLHQSGEFAVIRVKTLQQIPEDLQIERFEFAVGGNLLGPS
jgi:chromatin segregation and condensation protein Rec8/ScpA/Scc1 (kleisin family)